jgi:membrane protease subunit (stomatin/prohibitin family)
MVFSRGKSTKGDVARNTYTWPNEYKGDNVMYRLPTNVYYNDNMVVMEDEYLVFMRDGKAMHVFDQAGRYALTTQNVPILRTILPAITGIKQLGEVYYIQKREMRGKFGTPEPLTFRDTDFGVVRLRAFGNFSFKVVDPMMFITQFVGTRGWSSSDEIMDWLRNDIVQHLNDAMGELKRDKNMALLDMPAYLNEIEQIVLTNVEADAAAYGMKITKLTGMTITPPKEVQDAIDKRGAMGALGVNYMEYQTGKAIEGVGEGAAKGGGNATAAMAGLGAGAGIGLGMGGAMGQGMQQGSGQRQEVMVKCQECGALAPQDAKFCKECGKPMVKAGSAKCGKCGADNQQDAKFCRECGAPTKAKCPKCGKEQAGAKFCNDCGEKL